MKSIRNYIMDWIDVVYAVLLVLMVAIFVIILCGCISAAIQSSNETEIEFVEAVKYGALDSGETLFMTEDGNLYACDGDFAEENGSRFLIEFDTHGTADKTDDDMLSLWAAPQRHAAVAWTH